jgi:ribonucleoside-triphosphate reductase
MRTIAEIDKKIAELEEELDNVEGRKTEVYTRIVGYYRSLRNWNRGKREEYAHRVLFDPATISDSAPETIPVEMTDTAQPADDESRPVRYAYFYKETCPNCPPVRTLLSGVDLPGEELNVDTDSGTRLALEYGIYATPTVIFFDASGEEVYRTSSTADLKEFKVLQTMCR